MEPRTSTQPLLSPWQKRLVAAGLTALAVLALGLMLVVVFQVLRAFVVTFANVIWPLAAAGILALLLKPMIAQLQARGFSQLGSVFIIYGLFTLVVLSVASWLVPVLVEQVYGLIVTFPDLVENVRAFLAQHLPGLAERLSQFEDDPRVHRLADALSEQLQSLGEQALPLIRRLGAFALQTLTLATLLAIIPIYLFFFLTGRGNLADDLERQLAFVPERYRRDIVFLVRAFVRHMVAFFRGQLLVGLITGILLATGFTFAGLEFGIFFGLLLGALNIIPYLGTVIGLGSALPTAFFQPDGGLTLALIVLAIFIVVQFVESYFIAPKIMGDETGLHPLVVIIAIFFWGTAFNGILGMILGIPLTAFFIVCWQVIREHYLEPLAAKVEADRAAEEEPA